MGEIINVSNEVRITDEMDAIVKLLSEDNTVAEIAVILGLNKRTVDQRVFLMKKKLGVKTLYGLVALFFRKGLIN